MFTWLIAPPPKDKLERKWSIAFLVTAEKETGKGVLDAFHLTNGRIHVFIRKDWRIGPKISSSMIGSSHVTGYKIVGSR